MINDEYHIFIALYHGEGGSVAQWIVMSGFRGT